MTERRVVRAAHAHLAIDRMTTEELARILARPPTVALVPVGSVEPHGPHLPLATDTVISENVALRACRALAMRDIAAYLAPSIPYGVTEASRGFAGAVGVPAALLTGVLRAIAMDLLSDGWTHVCLVNNHLEPAHDAAVRAAVVGLRASVSCPTTRRWARTLSDEFKRGACHAGRYETSLVLAAGARLGADHRSLPALGISLTPKSGRRGVLVSTTPRRSRGRAVRFRELGLARAYTGAPAEATAEEGEELYDRLVAMTVSTVVEAIGHSTETGRPKDAVSTGGL